MDNEARLKYANDHFFSTGVGDGGASLGEINMRFGLAKIHYLQEQMGQAPDAIFVSAPDLTVTRNVNRWGSGYGYGGVLNWGDGSQELVILDLKPNACGMIVGGINQLVPMVELLERTHSLVLEPVEIDGIQIQWDFGKGNHFIDLFEVDKHIEVDLPPYIFIIHMAGGELRGETQYGPGLYWDYSQTLQSRMEICDTPFGQIRFLTGQYSRDYYEFYRFVEKFTQKRREFAANKLFDDYCLINNDAHQGMTHLNEIILGCYRFTDTQKLYPIGLRPDINAYLLRGLPNFNREKMKTLGFEERSIQQNRYDFLSSINILPHGGGYAFPDISKVNSVNSINGQRYFEVEMSSGKGRKIFSDIRNMPYEYRGIVVLERTLELEMAEVVASLKPLYVLKV
jgi:hypothetical protein